ncbi:taurine catabolism dioxygenase [Nadsonia fulvescens var. elongata DSM 6958]|uniref:Taurine catabolism dioxygenase n=1 Tax=Nadsonia fulvescens var. elongata DSM 6958 TaxID=857566 RepID=A0A1E3PFS1_9ASCO|nr:taurine catabolism dioxygenase [Nadsonia fulvescens var. elongata DSM 6958]
MWLLRKAKSNPRFANIKYKKFVPSWNANEKYEPLEDFEHVDRGHFANKSLENLLPRDATTQELIPGVEVLNLTPKFGTEVRGVQISQLSNAGKDELALFVAQRGVVIFRDQDLRDQPLEVSENLGRYFGRPHIHPSDPTAYGHPEVFLVYREQHDYQFEELCNQRTTSTTWHTDVSYERQPAGTTFLGILQQPKSGGDTLYADTVQAYERLSPAFKQRLEGLTALHSSQEQAYGAQSRGGVGRRAPVQSIHPVVRTHPVTKQKSLFVNPEFTRHIVGFKKEESDYLLGFLYDLITKNGDLQIRARWEDGTITVWDNRRAVHSAVLDWEEETLRHCFRITPQAEKPVEN